MPKAMYASVLALAGIALLLLLYPRVSDPPVTPSPTVDLAGKAASPTQPPRSQRPAPGSAPTQPETPQRTADRTPDPTCASAMLEDPAALSDEQFLLSVEEIEREKRAVVSRLEQAADAELRLAAVLLSREDRSPAEHLARLATLATTGEGRDLALWNLLAACNDSPHAAYCSDERLTALVQQTDHANSEAWAMLASQRLARGDTARAADAMQQAIGSPTSETYAIEHVQLFERAYAAASGLGLVERTVQALGDAAGVTPSHLPLFRACTGLGETDIFWRRLCFEYARQLASRSTTLLVETIAVSLQQKMAELDGDLELAMRLRQQLETQREASLEQARRYGVLIEELAFDEAFTARWLNELFVNGERAANAMHSEELERRWRQRCADG